MEIILFAGNSLQNKKWIETVNTSIKEIFDKTTVHYYHHWQTGKEMISFTKELEELKKYNLKECLVLAKSAGIILTLKGIKERTINPKKCFFIGTPLNWCKENNIPIEKLISHHKIPTVFMQNKHDPACNSNHLKEWLTLNKIANYKFIELEGNTHNYLDINKIKQEIKKQII